MGADPISACAGFLCFLSLGFYVFMYFYRTYIEPMKYQNFINLRAAEKANNKQTIELLKENVGGYTWMVPLSGACLGLFCLIVSFVISQTGSES